MKGLFLTVAVAALVLSCVAHAAFVVNDDIIHKVNSNPQVNWKAGHNQFSFWTHDEVRAILKTKVSSHEESSRLSSSSSSLSAGPDSALPSSFDARDKWGSCVHPIRNQLKCGSCWAFSASEVLSDRYCIASNSTVDVVLSPQYLVSCDGYDMGCNGGNLGNVWSWMKEHGIVSDACLPYTSGAGSVEPCPSQCADGSAFKWYRAASYKHIGSWIVFWKRVEEIQTAIMDNGPVQAAFTVYEDFMSYKSGVYKHTSGGMLGGHAIKIVGWGSENGEDYWLVANSWGPTWGLQGFFKILRGKDECGIEADVYGGEPAL